MSSLRRVPLNELPARRIALIKPSALGDVIHALPVLTALRRRFPAAHLTWVVNQTYEPLLRGHPDLDATLPFDRAALRGDWLGGARSFAGFLRRLRRECFDLVLDLQGLLRSGLMTAATGAARRVGLSTAREGAVWFYTDLVRVSNSDKLHAVDRYWLIAEALGAGGGPKTFRVPLSETDQHWADALLRDRPRPWLMLAPGARWQTKRWLPSHFAALSRLAFAETGGTVVLVGGQEDAALAQQITGGVSGPVVDLTGHTTLPRLAAMLARADVVVANDTGPLHLAAALGRRVVAPYTCTRARLTGPYAQPGAAVETGVACQGSLLRQCPHMRCMAELTPERLWPSLRKVLLSCQSNRLSA